MTYDTDLEKVKRLIKQIGRDLAADPELAPNIIDTLKMQGVEEYGDFAIKIRLKLTCKPGEQFVIRRRAYAMIKKAFEDNGIKFAFPTVQVAGGGAAPAAAHVALEGAREACGSGMRNSMAHISKLLVSCLLALLAVLPCPVAEAQTAAPSAAAPPPEVQQLVDLLRKPEVQAWLDQGAARPARTGDIDCGRGRGSGAECRPGLSALGRRDA